MKKIERVLAIGAHPDDIELGCGGSLAKLVQAGVKVSALILSHGGRGNVTGEDRCAETRGSLQALGIRDIVQCDFADTRLAEALGDIVDVIERECARVQPGRVYTMFREDRHQDHRAAFEASIVACRSVPQVLCYETPSSWPNFVPTVFEDVELLLGRKIAALKLHTSQRARTYMQESQIRCLADFRGQQISAGPCEGFIPYRLVL
ncbi:MULTISPECIES: PIG-L deacetylase family protein [unclassified Pseudoxanthomonas]|uniref:PIG-L deacetylase family protein n=1 Tax=unclassified Pseudoxanthomonas TaxID=2645906 RepID=UPI003076E7BD